MFGKEQMRHYSTCLAFFTCLCTPLFSLEYQDFDEYQEKWSRAAIEEKIQGYLQKDPEIQNYFSLSDDAFCLFASPQDKQMGEAEYCLRFGTQDKTFPKLADTVRGAKIALDPGHFGGWYARLEERYISISYTDENQQLKLIQYDEGTLAFLIALYVKEHLESEGALVLLTREGIGRGAYPQDFFAWLRTHVEVLNEGGSLSSIFRRHYNAIDLRTRAEKINTFQPDLTVMIHLNAHESSVKEKSSEQLTDKNYDMVFLPGAFCKGELAERSSRVEFLRMLVTQDVERSERLCKLVVKQFTLRLGVPAVTDRDEVPYLQKVCLKRDSGVYARNLCATRLVHSPLCYGESLIQNHLPEALRLVDKDTEIGGIPCSSRLKEIGDAYYGAIVEYFEKNDDYSKATHVSGTEREVHSSTDETGSH